VTSTSGASIDRCPICRLRSVVPLLELGEGPVFCNVQWATQKEARETTRGPISLFSCTACGHTYNAAFDPARVAYAPGYENSQHFSAVFRQYAQRLVDRLIETYGVRGRAVVDIGCGRGDLLAMLCERGENRGFGFDPSYAGAPAGGADARFTVAREYFDANHAAAVQPSLVCCRHVLEHVEDPVAFLSSMREMLVRSPNATLYLEVPNGEHLLVAAGLWDYLYEHVSHFSARSLEMAFQAAGFEVLKLYKDFGDQFLCADVRPRREASSGAALDRTQFDVDFDAAAAGLRAKLARWRSWADETRALEKVASVWGAGSKGVMFLNLLNLAAPRPIDWIIDQNPGKHGRFVSGTAQRIAGPAELVGSGVATIVLMNEIYRDEVRAQLAAQGLAVELLTA
jgi:SAM-dependent methyltransferase